MNEARLDCYLEAMHAEESHSDGGTDAAASNEDPHAGDEDCDSEMKDCDYVNDTTVNASRLNGSQGTIVCQSLPQTPRSRVGFYCS